jgi:hypothetical protein
VSETEDLRAEVAALRAEVGLLRDAQMAHVYHVPATLYPPQGAAGVPMPIIYEWPYQATMPLTTTVWQSPINVAAGAAGGGYSTYTVIAP